MLKKSFQFTSRRVDYYFAAGMAQLATVVDRKKAIIITDENVAAAHQKRFRGWATIVIKAGEQHKTQSTVDTVIQQLITLEADRKTTLIGVGGGVVTDITGYVASVYMRGISFGFIPTSLLALVDASIGGKNGIDVGMFKNMVGTINQPHFILHDMVFLRSLPEHEWTGGFAEIIKHACIKDAVLFKALETHTLKHYQKNRTAVCQLVMRNALLKTKVVVADEYEKQDRKLLNFGHTLGHALENQYGLSHGEAVAIGMVYAGRLSEKFTGFTQADRIVALLKKYGLPTDISFDKDKVIAVLKMDKKRDADAIHFILLTKIGKAVIYPISIKQLYENL